MDHRHTTEVEDIITSPPEKDPYSVLKAELVTRLSPSREQRIRQLLTLEMDDSKPSQFLGHFRSLAPDVPDDFLRSIWSSRLPTNIQAILAGQHEDSLDAAARSADQISHISPQPVLASVGPPPPAEKSALLQGMEDLSRQVATIRPEQDRLRANFRDPHRTIHDLHPARHIHDYSHQLFGSSIFSKIDLVRAYNQIPVHPDDIQKTAITTLFGLFEFPFMSFGLRNAAQTFQRFMDEVLRGLDFCFAYLDDILIFSRSPEEHEQHLRTLFDRLQKCGILINPAK
jgi:hypothetical protein